MSTSPVDWRRRLLALPREDAPRWHGNVAAILAMAVYGFLMGSLLSQGVDWWLAAVAPFGWTLPLMYITANLLDRRS